MRRTPRCVGVLVGVFILTLSSSGELFAQTSGRISGVATDETGGVLPGVTITVREVNTGTNRTLVTDGLGRYMAPQLQPGSYELTAELQGFQTLVRRGITLTVTQEAIIDVTLKTGSVSETVQVTGESPVVQTTSAQVGGLVDSRQMVDLPLNGRSFEQLALLQPGANSYFAPRMPEEGGGMRMTVSGSRLESNSFLLDGTNINDANNFTPGSAAGQLLGVDTLREFRSITSNFSSEYGRNSGGIIVAVTKSGTNSFHGNLFEFTRNSALDAKNFFDLASQPIPNFVRNQFGGTFGGPLKTSKAWFFGSYEGLRETKGLTTTANVPDAQVHQGFLGGQFVGVANAVTPYLALYPLPNGVNFGNGTAQYISSNNRTAWENYGMGKIDVNLSQKQSFFVRYTVDKSHQTTPQSIQIWQQDDNVYNQYLTAQHTTIFTNTLLGVFRFGLNRSMEGTDTTELGDYKSLYFLNGTFSKMGQISFSGITVSALGPQPRWPRRWTHTVPQFSEDLTYTKGAHFLKFGVALDRYLDFSHINTNFNNGGNYQFAGLKNFMLGIPVQFQAQDPNSNLARNWRQWNFATYAQDDLKLRNLTLNLGFRWEFITSPIERDGLSSNLINLQDAQITVINPFFEIRKKNLEPRVGFAWNLFGNGRTVFSGGSGIFHDMPYGYYFNRSGAYNPPFVPRGTLRATSYPGGVLLFPNGQPLLPYAGQFLQLYVQTYDTKVPTKYAWNLTLQQELVPKTAIAVSYVGSLGRNQQRTPEYDTSVPTVQNDRFYFTPGAPRVNPNFDSIIMRTTDGESSYNALQVNLQRRLANGLAAQVAYTWAHSIDQSSEQFNGATFLTYLGDGYGGFTNPNLDRSSSLFDVRHSLSVNFSYDIPSPAGKGALRAAVSGWQLSGLMRRQSGNPFTPSLSFNNSGDGRTTTSSNRPDWAPGRNAGNAILGDPARYFDPTAFASPPAGYYGNVGRNVLLGPGIFSLDASLVKSVPVSTNARKLQLRVECFNLTNHPNFGFPNQSALNPDGTPNPAAGRITTTSTDSREFQLAIKFLF